ncbi:hypothetical protein D3C72_915970 [compost metagenome]
MRHRVDQRQRGLALGQVVTQILAQLVGVGRVIQHVIGDLEGVAQVHAVVVQSLLGGFIDATGQCTQAGAGGEQHCGLALDHAQVGRFVGVRVVHVQQLQHFAFGDAVGGVGQDLHHRHPVQLDHQLEAARVQEVAHQHARRVAPQRIGGAAAAAQAGFVHHVVVQQGGGVDELDDRGQLVVLGAGAADRMAGQHHQHRAQAFAARGNDVVGDLVDQHHIRGQPAADQGIDGSHVGCGKRLDLGQAQGGTGVFSDGHAIRLSGSSLIIGVACELGRKPVPRPPLRTAEHGAWREYVCRQRHRRGPPLSLRELVFGPLPAGPACPEGGCRCRTIHGGAEPSSTRSTRAVSSTPTATG